MPILEHTTDSHGQTLATFALFDLVGKRLSPRIAKLTDKRLWRPHPAQRYSRWPTAGPLLAHHAQTDSLAEHWDDLLRIGGSLLDGHVSAALLITRLQAGSRQHPLAKALLEHGKLLRTVHALRWYTDETFRRRIGRQLNRGEALNDLRRFIFYANRGQIRAHRHEDQTTQATATPWSSTPASCPPPTTSKTPSTPNKPTARKSLRRPSPTSAPPTSKRSTPTALSPSPSPRSSTALTDNRYATSNTD